MHKPLSDSEQLLIRAHDASCNCLNHFPLGNLCMRVIILSITNLSLLPVGEYKIRGEIENQFCVRPDGARNCQPEVMRISPASLFLALTLVQRLPLPHSLLLTGYPLAHGPECREETS